MIFSLFRDGFSEDMIIQLLLSIPTVLLALSVHESAHGFMAEKLGDPTARCVGRITLNPAKHFDLFGMLCMLFLGFGWAKPVPINPNNFKNKKWGTALVGLAGPVSNLILAFFGTFLCHATVAVFTMMKVRSESVLRLFILIFSFFSIFASMNTYLAVFNLLPIPPFDGSRLLYAILPEQVYFAIMRYEQIIMYAVMFLLITDVVVLPIDTISSWILSGFDQIIGLVPGL